MKAVFGNNCAKGCLIYGVMLMVIVVITAMGLGSLGGLRARFGGAEVQGNRPQASVMSNGSPAASQQQAQTQPTVPPPAPASVPTQAMAGAVNSGGGGSGGGSAPTPVLVSPPPPPVTQPSPQAPQAPPQNTPAPPPPAQAQGGTITGEVSTPFYIVQAGDTLWAISRKFGVDLDSLRSSNSVPDDLIRPGQLLYLPSPGQSQSQVQAQAQQQPQAAPTPSQPGQPHTGVDSGSSQNPDSGLPMMPHTGITQNKP